MRVRFAVLLASYSYFSYSILFYCVFSSKDERVFQNRLKSNVPQKKKKKKKKKNGDWYIYP